MKLSLYYPCKPYIVFQKFGQNDACYNPSTAQTITKQGATCPAGFVGLYEYSGMKGHNGLDLFAPTAYSIYYAGPDGVVDEEQDEEARGLGLGITTNEKFECEGGVYQAKTRYWHLKSFVKRKGDTVKTGDLIAYADSTGYSSGSHLHFELKPVKMGGGGIYANVFQDNGFYGAVDPAPYFNGVYAEDLNYTPMFNVDMSYGQTSVEVQHLQDFLKSHGYFPAAQVSTGFYGPVTQKAVLAFQKDYVELSWYERVILAGSKVGPKTRIALNKFS